MSREARAPRGLYPIIDAAVVPLGSFPAVAEALAAAGCSFIQLRVKHEPPGGDRERLAVQRAVMRRLEAGPPVRLVINDRCDLARVAAVEARGPVRVALHLGQEDLPPADARALLGPDVVLGLSTHDARQVVAARDAPVDYLGFGPVFGTRSKEGADPTTGLDWLARACSQARQPVTAIGGLDGPRAAQAIAAGAGSAAMISALYAGLDLMSPGGLEALRDRARCLHDALR